MFAVYLVFGRRRIRVGDQKAAEKGEVVSLLDCWYPNPRPGESADDRLESEGLPKTPRLADFCFARKKVIDDAAGLVPPALPFVFTLTSKDGDRTHCYCLRAHRAQEESSHRIDVGGDWIETSVFVTRHPLHKLFPAALQICRVRRILDRGAFVHFLQVLHASGTEMTSGKGSAGGGAVKGPIVVDSPCLSVVAKYEFPTSKEPKLECIFDTFKPQALQFTLGAILLERRVCLVGRDEKRLSEAAYALTHLACGEMPLKGYCHNFVPVLPGALLEHGLGNPAPYVVGILRVNLKATDNIKELGDIVIVDLDSRVVRISPGGAPIVPLGVDVSSDGGDNGVQAMRPANDAANPWLDVCGPFTRDLASAFANRDVDLLLAAVRAVVLLVAVGKIGVHLEDPAIKLFNGHFRKTQIANSASSVNENSVAVILGNRGYPALRSQLVAQQSASRGPERANVAQIQSMVNDLTGGSSKGRPDKVTKTTVEVMKRSFDSWAFSEGIRAALKARLSDCQGRNWKYAYKALALMNLLVRMGSELAVADCWDELGTVFDLTRFTLTGVVGVPSRVADLVQKRARELYSLAVDLPVLRFSRSFVGHTQIQQVTRQKMIQNVSRLSQERDLKSLLESSAPEILIEPDVEDEAPPQQQQRPRGGGVVMPPPLPTNAHQSLMSGMPPPPPPPPVPHSVVNSGAIPPPPPPPLPTEGLLIDLDSVAASSSSNPFDALGGGFLVSPSASTPTGTVRQPPRTPMTMQTEAAVQSQTTTTSPRAMGRPVTKLISHYDKPANARPDTKLVTAFETQSTSSAGSGDVRGRRPPTERPGGATSRSASPPIRPTRAAPTKSSSVATAALEISSDGELDGVQTRKFSPKAGGWDRPFPPPPPVLSPLPASNTSSSHSNGPPGVARKAAPVSPMAQVGKSPTEEEKKAKARGPPPPFRG